MLRRMCYQLGIIGSVLAFAFTMWKSLDSNIGILEASIRAVIAGVIIMIAMLFIASLIENLGSQHTNPNIQNQSKESIDNQVDKHE